MLKIILCYCICVIVINVDICNEYDIILNYIKFMYVCFILGDLWRKVEDNVLFMVVYCYCYICLLSIMFIYDCKFI